MKLRGFELPLLVGLSICLPIQTIFPAPASTPASAANATSPGATNTARYDQTQERGAHHRLRQTVQKIASVGTNSASGLRTTETLRTNRFIEVATGLHYREGNQWVESRAVIEIEGNKGVAKRGPHKVIFASNLKDAGAIDLTAADGKRFRSHVLGLGYYDAASGKSALIAEVHDSQGQIVPPNQVIYRDAFSGVLADVRYTYKKSGFEQDVILRENLPGPEEYGLNPETTRLEVLTEFLDPPVPQKRQFVLRKESDPNRRAAMAEPDLIDELLDFGELKMVPGKAFVLQEAPAQTQAAQAKSSPVAKRWDKLEGRDFLIEAVEYGSVKEQLKRLPARQAEANGGKKQAANQREWPARRLAQNGSSNPFQMAGGPYQATGLVMDYVQVYSTYNFTFEGQETYYVSDDVTLSGITAIASGAVIKYAPSASITFYGEFQSPSSGTAYLTAVTDDSVGEHVDGASSSYYALPALRGIIWLPTVLQNLEIRQAGWAIEIWSAAPPNTYACTIRNCVFTDCATVVQAYYATMTLQDLWICNCPLPFYVDEGGSTYTVGNIFDCNNPDTDADGLLDGWEVQYFGNLNQTASGNPDGDGYTNLQEYQNGTNPTVFDNPLIEISKSQMTADASSFYPPWPPQYAINGSEADPGWHNCCYGTGGEWLRVDLHGSFPVARVKYRPRSPIHNGAYLQYQIFVTQSSSTSPSQWGNPVAGGYWDWPNGAETRTINFAAKQGRYVIFQCIQGVGGYASADEVWVYGTSPPADTDSDGLPDSWEMQYFGNLAQTAGGDPDGDGFTNLVEYQNGTNPAVFDASYTEISKSLMTADASSWTGPPTTNPAWPPQNAINGSENDPGWHNCCYGSGGEWLRVDLGASHSVGRVKYRPRSPFHNGVFLEYKIYVTDSNSMNPSQWGMPVTSGTWDWPNYAVETRTLTFTPKQGRYVVFQCVQGYGGYASAAEVWVYRMNPAADSDGDGLPDSWELQYFGNLNQPAGGDPDGDGLTNLQEYQAGTNPTLFNAQVKIARPRNNSNLP